MRVNTTIGLFIQCLVVSGGFGQMTSAAEQLFSDGPVVDAHESAKVPGFARRHRVVRLNPNLGLVGASSALNRSEPGLASLPARFVFNGFEGEDYSAVVDRTDYMGVRRLVCQGSLEGSPQNRFILACDQGGMSGWFLLPGSRTVVINQVGNGLYQIVEVEPARIRGCGVGGGSRAPTALTQTARSARPVPAEAASGTSPPGPNRGAVWVAPQLRLPAVVTNTNAAPAIIDLMVVYTPAALAGAGGTNAINSLIDVCIAQTQLCYSNSLINAQVNLVYRGEVNYVESGSFNTDLERLAGRTDGFMEEIHALRNQCKADEVCLLVETGDVGGIAELPLADTDGYEPVGFFVVLRGEATSGYAFSHEFGHTFGAKHDRPNTPDMGSFTNAFGFRFVADGVTNITVMAYHPGQYIPYFSNPDVSYFGVPTGVADGATNSANNAEVFNLMAPVLAGYRDRTNSLAEALDITGPPWLTGGDAAWFSQTIVTHDGTNAAQCGALTDGQSSWIQTRFNGPGTVSFWWKVSSRTNDDYLQFYVNDVLHSSISGEVGWEQKTFPVSAGPQTLDWVYLKNASLSSGLDRAWVDQVSIARPPAQAVPFVSPNDPTFKTNLVAGSRFFLNGIFDFTAPLSYQWQLNGVNIPDATNALYYLGNPQSSDSGSYIVTASNLYGQATSLSVPVKITPVPDFMWTRQAGGTNSDSGRGIAVDTNGNVYVTGAFSGTANFGSTSLVSTTTNSTREECFVAKYDSAGHLLWVRQAGGDSGSLPYGLAVDNAGNAYITGFFEGTVSFGPYFLASSGSFDVFLAKYAPDGTALWARKAGGAGDDEAVSIAVDSAGAAVLAGFFQGAATFGTQNLISSGGYDVFIAKYDTGGTLLWARSAGGSADDFGNGVDLDAGGNAYVTGGFVGTATFGATSLTSYGAEDLFIAKYDPTGNLLWLRQDYAYPNRLEGKRVAVDGLGNVFLTILYQDASGFYQPLIEKWTSTGDFRWFQFISGEGYSIARGIVADQKGNAIFAGKFYNYGIYGADFGHTTMFGPASADIFVAKIDSLGNFLWAVPAGGSQDDFGYPIAISKTGDLYITGSFQATASFGHTSLASAGSDDIFVSKLSDLALPALSIAKVNNTGLLSWPVSITDFGIESVSALSNTNVWSAFPATPSLRGATNQLSLPLSGIRQFFRLNSPGL